MEKHIDLIVSVVLGVITWAITFGVYKNKQDNLEEKVRNMEASGTPYARENIGKIEQRLGWHEQRLASGQEVYNRTMELLQELRTEVKVISEWIKSNKDK